MYIDEYLIIFSVILKRCEIMNLAHTVKKKSIQLIFKVLIFTRTLKAVGI